MPLPTTLMPWISILVATGLSAPTSRSASCALLVTVKYPPAKPAVVGEVRAQGRLMSMLMPSFSISFYRGQRRTDATTGRPCRDGGALSSSTSHSSNARVLGRPADDGGHTNHHALP